MRAPPDLLAQIRAGTALRKTERSERKTERKPPNPREDMLTQIRKGMRLNPVHEEKRSTEESSGGIGDVLRRAIGQRRSAVKGENEENEENEENDDNDWD